MIYTKNVKKAINIAYSAHMGQNDKFGIPYVFHPVHLAESMGNESECIVAILHDVVEDTSVTFKDLEQEFSKEVIDALKLLTHDKKVPYEKYIYNLKDNPIAKKVKLADLIHNSDITRLEKITVRDKIRNKKYEKAIKILSE
ncbi:MAG: GTP pyrophosphokinase [Bacilli bacterium]|nr:GTP pyrophosphokinase [Bacilli bacterium]